MAIPNYSSADLRERIRFETRKKAAEPDLMGNVEANGWTVRSGLKGIAAKLSPSRGGEQVLAGRYAGISNFDIVVRGSVAMESVTVGDRIVNERKPAQTFDIKWIGNLDERGQWLLLMCQEGGNDG